MTTTMRLAPVLGQLLVVAACSGGAIRVGGDGGTGRDAAAVDRSAGDSVWLDPDIDNDGDGYTIHQGDCDDTNPNVHPGAREICNDGIDNDCNGFTDGQEPDRDGDGFGPCQGDCDDNDPDVHPGAQEVVDGKDNNCDGLTDQDLDGDGYTTDEGDCDDNDPDVHPGAVEICGDGKDNDCNGYTDGQEPDKDGDGYGPCGGDCDDNDPTVHPGAQEVVDGKDNNCDNLVDEDLDGDGWTVENGDCNDSDPTVNPGKPEICNNGKDDNCNGITDTDCLTPCAMAAVMRSSVGCVYYAVDTNPLQASIGGAYAIAVSNVDTALTANVVVAVKSGANWAPVAGGTFTVGPRSLKTLNLPHRTIDGSAIYAGGAYRITSDLPVIAYQFNPIDGSTSYLSDASLLLPTSAYDRYYITPGYYYGPDIGGTNRPVRLQIVAMSATQVFVTSSAATVAGTGVPALTPGVEQSFNLTEGDYLQFTLSTVNTAFAGTYIRSTNPVGVFSSADCANVPYGSGNCCCEHLEEQIFGLQTWGKKYVAARAWRIANEPSLWQIIAQENTTKVDFSFSAGVTGLPATVTLNARQKVEYQVNGTGAQQGDFFVSADKPILVTQFTVGSFLGDGSNGDPDMVQAVPVEQFLSAYVVLVPSTWVNDTFTLTRKAGATVRIDGNAVTTGWLAVATSGYEVARVTVTDGVHVVDGTEPFGIIVDGYDEYDSYAYPGGLNQQLINPIN
ncbi:MAG: hypothetical protein HY906_12950 [Deltaproteobacteria bacterium]|nr:hypothetical protein [Deltaproteobacteria bacterium]